MTYRRLTNEELSELEPEFVRFLASNQLNANDWENLKETNPVKVEELIMLFSQIVFDKTIKGIEYLEFRSLNDIKTFHCLEEKIQMFGLVVEGNERIDFRTNMDSTAMVKLVKNSNSKVSLYSAEKAYNGKREAELYKMMESGCLISKDGAIFKLLSSLKS